MPPFPTISALHAAYASGLGPREVLAETYRRLAAIDDPGILLTLLPEAETFAAAALGPFDPTEKPLWGVPFAVKDNLDVAGLPTTAACPDFAFVPSETAPCVARLLAAGAILIGKTNLDQFATGLVGLRTPHPAPRNALNADLVPGGSSSGSAVAVAHGLVAFALGTDTAGSGRVPAGLNNVVGLKPSLGSVSSRGLLPACRTLDTVSVFAGTVADADRVFRIMAGYDAADPYSRDLPVPTQPLGLPPGLRVGMPDAASLRFGGDPLSEAAFVAGLDGLATLTGRPDAVDLAPMFAIAALLYDGPWVAERYQAIRPLIERSPQALHPTTRAVIAGPRPLLPPTPSLASTGWPSCAGPPTPCGSTSTYWWCRPTRGRSPAPNLKSIRSAPTANSGPTQTSSICSTSARSRCRAASGPTACRRASR